MEERTMGRKMQEKEQQEEESKHKTIRLKQVQLNNSGNPGVTGRDQTSRQTPQMRAGEGCQGWRDESSVKFHGGTLGQRAGWC